MNSSRFHLENFVIRAGESMKGDAIALDAGAGDCRYARHFEHVQYESADFAKLEKSYGELTYECDITSIPCEDARFDAVLCTQVLAHLPRPVDALKEFRRVLKPGGRVWLTAPLFFQENEPPYDFYRYTQHGLRFLFAEAGLEIESLEWLEGYAGTASYQLKTMTQNLPTAPAAYGSGLAGLTTAAAVAISKPFTALLAIALDRADKRRQVTDRGHCKNYAVVASRVGDRHDRE